ncbi:MAG: hypothetical protein ACLP1X_07655 [Polyangiaceae bacterium]
MTRLLMTALLTSTVAVSVGACGDDSSDFAYANGGPGGAYPTMCSAYTTCGSCTPVIGCGWCFGARGGSCAPDPDSCGDATEFTWTWNASGCPDVDASVVPLDAGASASPDGTTPTEAAAPLDAQSERASD